jgi:hypothetical protein
MLGGRKRREDGEDYIMSSFVTCTSSNIWVIKTRRMRWAGHVAHMGAMRNAHKILFESASMEEPHGRSRRRWEDSIRMDLRETEWKNVHWMHLAQNGNQWQALVNTVMNLRVP